MKWIIWTNATTAPVLRDLASAMGVRGHVTTEPNQEAEKKAREEVQEKLKILDGALEGKNFLLGEKYSLADTHVHGFMEWLKSMGFEFSSLPNLDKWVKSIEEQPGMKKHMEAMAKGE